MTIWRVHLICGLGLFQKCLNAVVVFGFVMPSEWNSCHRFSALHCVREPALKIFALGCIPEIGNQWAKVLVFMCAKWTVRERSFLECMITFLHCFQCCRRNPRFHLVMVRMGASLSKVVCKTIVICFLIVSIVLFSRGSEKSSSNSFANSVWKVVWSSFESWRDFIVTGLGRAKDRLRLIKSWPSMNGESDWEKLWIKLRLLNNLKNQMVWISTRKQVFSFLW